MTTLRISELAARGGVPATTVRYYEQLGLLSPPPRTADNQRRYGDSAVTELRFVRQAKHLGLSLTEIGELVAIRGTGRCASVQSRLAALVAERRSDVVDRRRELDALDTELRLTAEQLESTPANGPCSADCGCSAERSATADVVPPSGVPAACTLAAWEQPSRLAEWAELARRARHRGAGDSWLRLAFPFDARLAARLADLCARELTCCAFFDFSLQIGSAELVLTVSGPSPADLLALLPELPPELSADPRHP